MAFKDNRDFITVLAKSEDVVKIIEEVDWDIEVGAIVRRSNELRAPAPFFETIKGYSKDFRIFGAPLATYRRLAIAMGLTAETSIKDILMEYERRIQHPIKPIEVQDAPCKENIIVGDDIDLYKFPCPMIHDGDGGRYIGTWHVGVCKDFDSDWVNWGMYRQMVLNKRYLASFCHSFSDQGRIFFNKYEPNRLNMPAAIVIGADPISSLVAGASFKIGESEADYAGALREDPVELVKCETSELLVPAHAEIILEGEILAGARVEEGPFGEYPGYRSPRGIQLLFRVNAITHRNNPILTVSCMGIPVDDAALTRSIDTSVQIRRALKQQGIPFTDVFSPAETTQHLAVISIRKKYNYTISQIHDVLSLNGRVPAAIIVDDDVDVFNMSEVIHAFATKCHPNRGISIRKSARVGPLRPYLSIEEIRTTTGPNILFDCTWPLEWSKETRVPPRMSFDEAYPENMRKKVLQNWSRYGYK